MLRFTLWCGLCRLLMMSSPCEVSHVYDLKYADVTLLLDGQTKGELPPRPQVCSILIGDELNDLSDLTVVDVNDLTSLVNDLRVRSRDRLVA